MTHYLYEKNFSLKITPLGTQSPYAKANSACPSFLIESYDGVKLILDCGSGSHRFFDMQNLKNVHIFISHFHKDHYTDLFNYMYTSFSLKNNNLLNEPINIYIPSAPKESRDEILNEKATFSIIHEIKEEIKYKINDFCIEFLSTIHSEKIESYAFKISYKNFSVVYTGDLQSEGMDILIEFSKNCDILISESSLLESYNNHSLHHLTAKQAGEMAKRANASKLILTHFWPEEDTINYYNEAKKYFDNVYIAKEKDIYLL